MDSINHLTQTILVERARQTINQSDQLPDTAPPPYTASEENDSDSGSACSDEDDEDDDTSSVKLTINAANSIEGSNNLVPTSPSPLADATKFSALLLHAVNRINSTAGTKRQGRINVELTINCGVTVVGDRNVVGNIGLKPKAGASRADVVPEEQKRNVRAAAAVGGAKRKVDDEDHHDVNIPFSPSLDTMKGLPADD